MIRPPPSPPDAASVLRLLDAIERHPAGTPAGTAFRSALRRMGLEADAAGGLAAVNVLMQAAVQAEPDRADQRQAILRAAWAELIPGTPRWSAPPAPETTGDPSCR